jgi:trehalose 6-phosphate phosphatase
VLSALLRDDPLLAFDYDGTLSPIVPDRHEAFMRPRTRELLQAVAELRKSAIITGRARDDMIARVAGIGLAEVVGNHGMEPSQNEAIFERRAQAWIPRLEPRLRRIAGAELENKRLSLSVHYRRSPSPSLALRDILLAAQELGNDVQVVRGRAVVNLLPSGAGLKSSALRRLMTSLGAARALFVGDDWTDEEVFQNVDQTLVMTIRVGRFATSAARYYLRSQSEIDDLLEFVRSQSLTRGDQEASTWSERGRHG